MEAVKQGGAVVGCKVRVNRVRKINLLLLFLLTFSKYSPSPLAQNNDYVVLATLKRAASELSSSQKKLFKIDDNVGIAISGLTADGTAATKALRGDCISHKFTFESEVDIGRLAARVADKSQVSSCLNKKTLHERLRGYGLISFFCRCRYRLNVPVPDHLVSACS